MKAVVILCIVIVVLMLSLLILISSRKSLQEKYEAEKEKMDRMERDYLRYKCEQEAWGDVKRMANKKKKGLKDGSDRDRLSAADDILRNW